MLKEKHGHAGKEANCLAGLESYWLGKLLRGLGKRHRLTAAHLTAEADAPTQGGVHEKGMNTLFLQPNTAEIMAIFT